MIDEPARCRPSRPNPLPSCVTSAGLHSPQLPQKLIDRGGETQLGPVVHALHGHVVSLQDILWPIDKLFGQTQFVEALGSLGGTLIWGKNFRELISSPSLDKQDEEAFRIIEQIQARAPDINHLQTCTHRYR